MRRVRRGSCDLADFESVFCEIMTTEWQGKRPGGLEIFANVYAGPVSLVLIVCWSLHQHVYGVPREK